MSPTGLSRARNWIHYYVISQPLIVGIFWPYFYFVVGLGWSQFLPWLLGQLVLGPFALAVIVRVVHWVDGAKHAG